MEALITILINTAQNTYHPIYYFEKYWPGEYDEKSPIRYKSKGHHTAGFKTFDEAVSSAKNLSERLTEAGHIVNIELDSQILWNGEDIPADTQVRIRRAVI